MVQKILCLLLIMVPITAGAEVLYHESWETRRSDGLRNDIGANTTLRARNNSCNSVDFRGGVQICGNTCGDDNEGRCCRSNDPDWHAETNGSIIEDWATARFNGGERWTLNGNTHTVPEPVDGSWVYRAYVPDCSRNSPYRCNDFRKPVRLRSLISSLSGDNINSADATRWYGFATWLDPEWDISGRGQYDGQTMASIHLPNAYPRGGGGAFRLNFRKGYRGRPEWVVVSMLEAGSRSEAQAAGCTSPSRVDGKWGCGDRRMEILDPDGSPSGNLYWEFDHEKDTGQWLYWVVQIKMDSSGQGDGILRVWRKRQDEERYWKLIDYTGSVGPMSNRPGYWKMGISDKDESDTCPKIIYYDAFTVGDSASNFSEVDPSTLARCGSGRLGNCGSESDCRAAGGNWCNSVCQAEDCAPTAAPLVTLVQPTQPLPYGTTAYTEIITTNEPAECRFRYEPDENAPEEDVDFGSMTGRFATSDGLRHTKEITPLKPTSWFFHDIKCRNSAGHVSVQTRSEIKVLPNLRTVEVVQPVAPLPQGTTSYTEIIKTNEPAECRFQYEPDEYAPEVDIDYETMTGRFSTSDGLTHTKRMNPIKPNAWFFHDIKCRYQSGGTSPQIRSEIKVMGDS